MSILQCIAEYLSGCGSKWASASDVCEAVRESLGEVPVSSIYSTLYGPLPGAKDGYRPLFERQIRKNQNVYRLLKDPESLPRNPSLLFLPQYRLLDLLLRE